jgi:hypothetical protein
MENNADIVTLLLSYFYDAQNSNKSWPETINISLHNFLMALITALEGFVIATSISIIGFVVYECTAGAILLLRDLVWLLRKCKTWLPSVISRPFRSLTSHFEPGKNIKLFEKQEKLRKNKYVIRPSTISYTNINVSALSISPSQIACLLRPRTCLICCEESTTDALQHLINTHGSYIRGLVINTSDYPIASPSRCQHCFDVCDTCIATHIATQIDEGNLDRIRCPQYPRCHRVFTYEEIREFATLDTFAR